MEDRIINFLAHKRHTIKGLFAGFLLVLLVLVLLTPLIDRLLGKNWYYAYTLPLIIWLIIWLFNKYRLPRNKKDKIGVCLLVYAENKIDEFKFKKDFIVFLKDSLSRYDLLRTVRLIVVKNHFSERIQEIDEDRERVKIIKKWSKKTKTHFLIWGKIKRRQEKEHKFFLELDSMIRHIPIESLRVRQEFKKEMLSIFPKEIDFYEKFELKGFQTSAELISIAIQYIVGTAALISRDPFLALRLHNKFLSALGKFKKLPPNFKFIKERVIKMLSVESSLVGSYYYEVKKDIGKMFSFANDALNFDRENYQAYLLISIYHFLKNRDVEESLKTIELAGKYSNGDSAWKYSKAFLYCYIGDIDNAIRFYSRAFRGKLLESEKFLKKIISFIENIIEEEPSKIQLYFALGKIYYQKMNNLPMALKNYKKFLKARPPGHKFSKAIELAGTYISDIEEKMKKGFR